MTVERQLRQASVADIERLMQLDEVCFDDPWSQRLWLSMLEKPGRYLAWVVESQGEVIAFILFSRILDEAELLRIGTRPDFQGQGVARTMLLHAQELLAQRGVGSFHLEVRESNHVARQLYKGAGWSRCGRRKNYYADEEGSEDALLFSLLLG